jgi:hypothetical protein
LAYSTSARLQAYGFCLLKYKFVCIAKDTIFTLYNNLKQNKMAQFKFTWQVNGLQKSKVIEAENQEQAEFLWEFQIGKPTDIQVEAVPKVSGSYVEKLRFLHKQSLANLRMIEEAEDAIERDRWAAEYSDNQIELINLQQINRALC